MKKRDARRQLRLVHMTARSVSATMAVNGEPVDTEPIIAGIAAGIGYAGLLLEDGDDDYVTDPDEVVKRLILSACEIAGLVAPSRAEEKEEEE